MCGDKRKTFRIIPPPGQATAILRLGARDESVRLVDESIGGFCIGCKPGMRLQIGQVLKLRTARGWHEVRLVRCEALCDGLLVGLERIRDLDDPRLQLAIDRTGSSKFGFFGVSAVICLLLFVLASLLADCRLPFLAGRRMPDPKEVLGSLVESVWSARASWQQEEHDPAGEPPRRDS